MASSSCPEEFCSTIDMRLPGTSSLLHRRVIQSWWSLRSDFRAHIFTLLFFFFFKTLLAGLLITCKLVPIQLWMSSVFLDYETVLLTTQFRLFTNLQRILYLSFLYTELKDINSNSQITVALGHLKKDVQCIFY